jgi:hypothetical membrane protein
MEERVYALFGVIGPLLVYITIAVTLYFSPWFDWQINALSDMGHSVTGSAAFILNVGMLAAGFLMMLYALTVFKKHAKYSSYCLLASSFFVQLLGTFNETYGQLHYAIAVPHFLLLSATSIVYSYEKRSVFALATFLIVMLSWLIYSLNVFSIGIAVPETISKLVLAWIMYSAIQIYRGKAN